jgi:hypothetical protein
MRNQQVFFEENIYIVNPFSEKLRQADSIKSNNLRTVSNQKNTEFLNFKIDKQNFNKREKVTLKFTNNESNHVSISVRKLDEIQSQSKINSLDFIQNYKTLNTTSKKTYLPELRGELYQGKIYSEKGDNVSNKTIGISFIGENKITKTSITNNDGEFYFNIAKAYESENVIIEVLNENSKNYTISIISNDTLEKEFTNFPELYLTENIRKTIKERSLYAQIENAYQQVKPIESKKDSTNNYVFQLNKNNVIYNLDDYTRFKTVKEVAVEILQDVWLNEKDGNYSFGLRDINLESASELETLLIVDGFIIYNHTDFVFFDAMKIKSFEIVKEKYLFGSKVYQGILNVSTLKNDYNPNIGNKNKFSLLKTASEKILFQPDYSADKNDKIPDFRTQLYWNTNLKSTENELFFYTSDVTGTFEIIAEGFTKDGIPIYEKTFFTVK